MAKHSDIENLYKFEGVGAEAIAAAEVSRGIDCKGYEQAMLVISTNTLAATYVGTVTIEDSDDDGSGDAYALVAGATITIADSDDDTTLYAKLRLNVPGVKRWIRCTLGIATAAGPTGVMLIVGNKSGSYPVDTKVLQFDVNTGIA
jgi:hypothetical protein